MAMLLVGSCCPTPVTLVRKLYLADEDACRCVETFPEAPSLLRSFVAGHNHNSVAHIISDVDSLCCCARLLAKLHPRSNFVGVKCICGQAWFLHAPQPPYYLTTRYHSRKFR